MRPFTVVVGAGIAGLAAAVMACAQGDRVLLLEAAPYPGGRCRLWRRAGENPSPTDLGTHLILQGNRALWDYLRRIEASDGFIAPGPKPGSITLIGESGRLTLPLGARLFFDPPRPLTRRGLLAFVKLFTGGTVGRRLDLESPIGRWVWRPLARAILNMDPYEGDARLFGAVLRQSLLRGAAAARPLVPRRTLDAALIQPAVAYLEASGAILRMRAPVRALDHAQRRVTSVHLDKGETLSIPPTGRVLLAVPPAAARRLLPNLTVPTETRAILNAHAELPFLPDAAERPELLGLIDGTGEWFLRRGRQVAITVSDADWLRDLSRSELKRRLLVDLFRLYGGAPKALHVLWERRATFASTPEQSGRRPDSQASGLVNLRLAGDWTATGLPATLEGAVRSGFTAAER